MIAYLVFEYINGAVGNAATSTPTHFFIYKQK